MMDKNRIEKQYKMSYPVFKTLSDYGPVKSLKTTIIRRSDNKLMGEVITFRSYYGWSSRILPYGRKPRKDCSGREKINYGKLHSDLFKKIFILKKGV